jgi:predicted AAA+ superfamily ATPase
VRNLSTGKKPVSARAATRPWHANVSRSLRKEPKYYLWDWAMLSDAGARNENMVASHLLKAVHYWTDLGLGEFNLFFLRTKDKREVDFLVSRDGVPWFLVEVKSSDSNLSPNLNYFQKATGAKHAFQVIINAPFSRADCFSVSFPVKVPAKTFLSQLV